ncbi:MAG: GDP-mannose 4,6-dehydratase [Thermoleophilaceae bacterium]
MSERYKGVPVLVTGATGFIGSRLAERLLDQGAEVVVPRRDEPAKSYFRISGLEERCTLVQADLLDFDGLVRIVNEHGVKAVFHLAAQTIVGTANRSPLSTFESNIRGTYNVLEACRVAGVVGDPVERVVVASSDKAYGSHEQLPYREDFALQPEYPYDVSKAATDMIARSYALTYGLPTAVTRFANIYGGGDFNLSRIVPDTARALVEGERPVIRSDGSPQRDYMHVEDAASAYLRVAESLDLEANRGRAWNAGAGEPVAVIEIVRRMIAVSGSDVEPDIQGEGTPHGEIDRQWLDSTAIREELGWKPEWDLDRGLADAYAWYQRHMGAR